MSVDPLDAAAYALFERILDLDPGARAAVLDEECAGWPELRARVETLLARDAEASTLLDGDASQLASALLDEGEAELGMLGPYRLVSELGRGGMGTVYLAERADGAYEQHVAVKLVKRGMDTDEVIERFRHERRILASLEHPNIARLLDGGVSPDGRPYLVMDLVRGQPITAYCDEQRLNVDDRLALFGTVCAAVQHAHQKLVVHRDIKPSNILVAHDGTPRLLDFGIAKLLADDAETAPRTRTGLLMLTPEYAAPEQLSGEPATTATDVYALGAVLHELLVGARPFDAGRTLALEIATRPSTTVVRSAAAAEVATARSTTPDRLRKRLAGDLDAILLRTLDPDPARRYGSAQQLLDDIERHRTGRPVHASAPTLAYVARKFVRRHRSFIAATTVVLLTLLGGLGATMWQAHVAATERDAANLARRSAEQVTAFLVDIFDSADPLGVRHERTDTLRVREVVDRAAQRVRHDLAAAPRVQADILTTLGRVYANLGDFPRADTMLLAALAGEAGTQDRVVPLSLLAASARQQGDFARADSLLRTALDDYSTGREPDSLYAATLTERGLVLMYLGEYDEARALNEQALAAITAIGAEGGALHATALNNHASLLYQLGDYTTAERAFREALDVQRAHLPESHPRLASTLNNIASSVHYQGRHDEARPLYDEAIRIARISLGPDHSETGTFLQNLASLYDDQDRYEEAEPIYHEAIRVHEVSLGRTNVNTALLLRNFALNRYALGRFEEAESLLREAYESIVAGLGEDHLYAAVTAAALGRVLMARGRLDDAEPWIASALASLEAQLPAAHFLISASRRDLGAWHARRGNFEEAEPLLLRSYEDLLAARGPDDYLTREARDYLYEMYVAMERPEQAAAYVDEQ